MKYLLVLAICLFAHSMPANAITNGGFETGDFTGWSIIGDALVINSSFGTVPPRGSFHALISNAPSDNSFNVNPDNLVAFSGTNSVSPFEIAPFLGVSPDDWTTLAGPFDSSGIKQAFFTTGGFLTFTWNYLSDESGTSAPFVQQVDPAFLVLDGSFHSLIAGNLLSISPSPSIFLGEAGYQTTSIFLGAGTHTVAFVIGEHSDPEIMSALLIDNVFIVSEGPAWLLFVLGLITFAAVSSRSA
jgi:hypothetical protein